MTAQETQALNRSQFVTGSQKHRDCPRDILLLPRAAKEFRAAYLVFVCALALVSIEWRAGADAVDDYIAREMSRRQMPGLALAVVQHTNVLKLQGYGIADLESRRPVDANTTFEIGSITKQFTATLVMMLVEEKKLRLDDQLPRFLSGTPDDWSRITIRHLLTHTSGIPNYTGLDGFEVSRHLTAEQFVRLLGSHPLEFQPGEKYAYCNSGYNLLGFIIEKVTRKRYWDVLRERIFEPLQMQSSFSRDFPQGENRALGYEKKDDHLVGRDSNLTDVFAAGAIVSTVLDLSRWNAALDSEKLLKRGSLEQMWTPVNLNSGHPYLYGFGWRLDPYKDRKDTWHSGSTSGFSASLHRFPEKRLTVIVLCNLGEQAVGTVIARGVADLVWERFTGGNGGNGGGM